jgi:threonylcarbamoyladenosine tRNA methylthiotransferase MtaB
VVFGADLIAGFPTETEAMAARSRDIVDECGLTYLHVFPFSPRRGTPAARMPQVPRHIARRRAAELRAAGARRLADYLCSQIGTTTDVLVERAGRGRTPGFAEVTLPEAWSGITPARIVGATATQLIAEAAA